MKHQKTITRWLFTGALVTLGLLGSHGQTRPYLSNTDDTDNFSDPSRMINHTGSGSLTDRHVMVYSFTNTTDPSYLGWDYNSVKDKLKLNGGGYAQDPDVVLASIDNQDYALVAFINDRGYVQWESYQWDSSIDQFVLHSSCELGTTPGCENPNVDANKDGMAVITWHEKEIDYQNWQVSFGFDLEASTGTYPFIVSDVFAAYGYVDGSGPSGNSNECACKEEVQISGALNCRGDQVSPVAVRPVNYNSDNELYEYNISPDVAISVNDGLQTIVTFTYVNGRYQINPVNAAISSSKRTVYQQEKWNTTPYGPFNAIDGLSGTPRIASRQASAHPDDIEIVTASGGCSYQPIRNWGIYEGNPQAVVVVNPDYTGRFNGEPVVAYRGGSDADEGLYTIVWTCETDFCLDEKRGLDVHSRTFIDGVPYTTGTTEHSYVNKGDFQGNGLFGDQYVPSVSGRLSDHGNYYVFFEDYDINALLFKYSPFVAGLTNLRTASTPGPTLQGGIQSRETHFGGYPNPFRGELNFEFDLEKEEHAKYISLVDTKGAEIARIIIDESIEGKNTVHHRLLKALPAGMYIARLVTNQTTRSIEVTHTPY